VRIWREVRARPLADARGHIWLNEELDLECVNASLPAVCHVAGRIRVRGRAGYAEFTGTRLFHGIATDSPHSEDLSGIHQAERVEGLLNRAHDVHGLAVLGRKEAHLPDADAMFARAGATHGE
jgi:hypothetical protein